MVLINSLTGWLAKKKNKRSQNRLIIHKQSAILLSGNDCGQVGKCKLPMFSLTCRFLFFLFCLKKDMYSQTLSV